MNNNGLSGNIFLFNPSYLSNNVTITFNGNINLLPENLNNNGKYLITQIYPIYYNIALINYNQTLSWLLDGSSVSVYEINYYDQNYLDNNIFLIGINGNISITSDLSGIIINNASQELGKNKNLILIRPNILIIVGKNINLSNLNHIIINNKYLVHYDIDFNTNIITIISGLANSPAVKDIYLPRSARLGLPLPLGYTGGSIYRANISVSSTFLNQLATRAKAYPIDWTSDELQVGWLAPHRLLAVISIINSADNLNIQVNINQYNNINNNNNNNNMSSTPVTVMRSYNSRHVVSNRFLAYFIDLSNIVTIPNQVYQLEVTLPSIPADTFQGIFLENIETMEALF